ncbi:MAG: triose-phosphate isomerase, partial [Gemmatimonadetes bacterium]|nr:triose-phosphate isomerase [Gemmatimonadota bacterium]NIQ59294.1 triose-phosphate isomerase [Gemmatimonadota bacterium]NIU79478.1 triose-phosphate isomerase [Gammaproteobacteria bacterium]NIX44166.1 triose-phosphate isomerase [Gemmatimonadota bacterium]NIY08389.1 triose-phosphate isomerase [Gemmatimonadota bacterium]
KLEERRAGRLEEVIIRQLDAGIAGIDDAAVAGMLVAYEPVWAIGTGETATPDDAAEAHGVLRARLRERIGDE